jgi:tripartite-type tricarboxylate transporter receptor subunit TctC
MQRRRLMISAVLAASLPAQAQRSSQPIRIIVGAPPGGPTDILARGIAPEMGRQLGRTVLVENKSGASGNLAADMVAKATPDGTTLLASFTGHTVNASLFSKLPFDPVADFTPLTMIATSPSMLVAHPSAPFGSLKELIAYARAHPGKLDLAVPSVGSGGHMAGEAFKLEARVYLLNIPYRGNAPALADVLSGQVPLIFANIGTVRGLVEAGKLRALGVTSRKRMPQFPNVPAIAEVLPKYESMAWFGLFGPANMAADTSRTISEAARAAISGDATFRRNLEENAMTPVGNPAAEFARFVKEDVERWRPLVKYSGARME